MIEKKKEFYSIDCWDDAITGFCELCRSDDLLSLKCIYNRMIEENPNIRIKLCKILHIEVDKTETILNHL